MIIGIVEINDRRHCVGVWDTIDNFIAAQEPADLKQLTGCMTALGKEALRTWGWELSDAEIDRLDVTWYGDGDYVHLYEFDGGTAPGLIGFDED